MIEEEKVYVLGTYLVSFRGRDLFFETRAQAKQFAKDQGLKGLTVFKVDRRTNSCLI